MGVLVELGAASKTENWKHLQQVGQGCSPLRNEVSPFCFEWIYLIYQKNDLFSQCRASLLRYFVRIVFRGRIVCKSVGKGTDLIQSSPNKSFQIQGLLFLEKFSGVNNSEEFPFQKKKGSLPSLGSKNCQ